VTTNTAEGTFAAEVVDSAGARYLELSGYRTVAAPLSINADAVKELQCIVREECEVEPV
jgi:hypothetical protein